MRRRAPALPAAVPSPVRVSIPVRAVAVVAATLLLVAAGAPSHSSAQEPIILRGPDGRSVPVSVASHRGYAAFPASVLGDLGWEVRIGSSTVVARLGDDVLLELRAGSPFYAWNGEVRQLVEGPYFFGERFWVPLQLLVEALPGRLEDRYSFDPASRRFRVTEADLWTPGAGIAATETSSSVGSPLSSVSGDIGPAVVVIDPGHGGRDTGALGPGGIREKDIAMGVARALQRELSGDPEIEVHLTRDRDVLIPIWRRGELATDWKGDRPGIFLSLHANAAGRGSSARGFETYFLSEARTEHERRVAALENSVVSLEDDPDAGLGVNPDLGFILSDLRNRDHQRWSALLADLVQAELAPVHPGPNRGVKQGPFAVITNALMPAVLVEMGFITHPDEARTLDDPRFQEEMAGSLARAVRSFFQRYPPGTEAGAEPDGGVGRR